MSYLSCLRSFNLKNFYPNRIRRGSLSPIIDNYDIFRHNYAKEKPLTVSFRTFIPKNPEITTSEVYFVMKSNILILSFPDDFSAEYFCQ